MITTGPKENPRKIHQNKCDHALHDFMSNGISVQMKDFYPFISERLENLTYNLVYSIQSAPYHKRQICSMPKSTDQKYD